MSKEIPQIYPPEMDIYNDKWFDSEMVMPEPTKTIVLFNGEKQNPEPPKEEKE